MSFSWFYIVSYINGSPSVSCNIFGWLLKRFKIQELTTNQIESCCFRDCQKKSFHKKKFSSEFILKVKNGPVCKKELISKWYFYLCQSENCFYFLTLLLYKVSLKTWKSRFKRVTKIHLENINLIHTIKALCSLSAKCSMQKSI